MYAELHDLVDRRLPDRLHRTEVSQERTLARGTDPFYGVKRRRQRLASPDLAVMGDRETVRLVADALDEEHARRVPLLHDRLGSAGGEDLLSLLRPREGRDGRVAGGLHHLEGRAQLALAAVDQDEVGPAGERMGSPNVRLLRPAGRTEALEPP